jgi:acyl-CoA thioesterase
MNTTSSTTLLTAAQPSPDQVGQAMWAKDPASQGLGMKLEAIKPGYALISMIVRADMLNGHQTCHGGFLFALADSAFAFSCNSRNLNTVAAACHIDFLAPGREGDVLEAEAVERSLAGRTGVYDVTVRIRGGQTIALFRGKSYRIRGEIIDTVSDADSDVGMHAVTNRSAKTQAP